MTEHRIARLCRIGAVSSVLAASLIAGHSPAATAAQVTPVDTKDRLGQLVSEGADDGRIERELGLRRVSTPDSSDVGTMSSSSDVSISTPTIYWDKDTRKYFAASTQRWRNTNWTRDKPSDIYRNETRKVGGRDGIGIRFSKDVVNYGASATVCPSRPTDGGAGVFKCFSTTAYWENSASGAAFKFQDKIHAFGRGHDHIRAYQYNAAKVTIIFNFRRNSGGCLQVFSRGAHTWSSTSVSGFSVSNSGFSVSFSKSSNYWQRTSAAGRLGCA